MAGVAISCDDTILPTIIADDRMRELLADDFKALFGMKCTPDMISKYKFYTPLGYSKQDSVLAPLAGGKLVSGTILEDSIGHQIGNHHSTLAEMAEAIPAGSKIRLVLSLSSLYFSAETKCKLSVKVERIALIEAGSGVAGIANYSFDDQIYV